ncbi:hypothetical protein NQX30_04655 [Candidatus Persebacteraceae bacterium Df01]|jgi:hypothetical protein|uniref:Uncharacterized protein n=1 Tax=Candidatus Doriopsillibacter californiensis TaxID=2970740 RepID=A0ABT7QMM7_9GAMM|nr:hypothetical protein [Candidatus Persebacteraceae bacterium Df01]
MGLDILINGTRNDTITSNINQLTVTDVDEDNSDTAEIIILVGDKNIPIPRIGVKVNIYYDHVAVGGQFVVNKISSSNTSGLMYIDCAEYDCDSDMRTPRDASYQDVAIGEIVTTIANRYGVKSSVHDAIGSLLPGEALQRGETDLSFLRRLAAAAGAKFIIKKSGFYFLPQNVADSVSGSSLAASYIDVTDPNVTCDWVVSSRKQSSVIVKYYDDDRVTVRQLVVGDNKNPDMMATVYVNRHAAELAAVSALARKKRNIQELSISTKLSLSARAGHPLTVAGLPFGIATEMKISRVKHFFSAKSVKKTDIRAFYSPFTG